MADLRAKFVASLIVPYEIRDKHLVKAINEAIQKVAKENNIDLGLSSEWEVKVWWDHEWRGEADLIREQSNSLRSERLHRRAERSGE
jgi:hypothetical protein